MVEKFVGLAKMEWFQNVEQIQFQIFYIWRRWNMRRRDSTFSNLFDEIASGESVSDD